MSSRKKKAVRKAARARVGTRTRKKAARKAGSRKKASRKKVGRRAAPPPRPQPVETLPKKYNKYFQDVYNGKYDDSERISIRCCGTAPEIPEDDRGIGERFAQLTASLRAYDPSLGITDEEIETIRTWRPDQLRTLRAAFLEIYYPPGRCRRPRRASFRGWHTPGSKSIGFTTGDVIEVKFTGP